jgi:hypothetical protein
MEPLRINLAAVSQPKSAENSQSLSRKALILRCQLALFSAYRTDQYADPEGFKNSLGAVLEDFSDEVIVYVCDPRTGLQRRMKWPPTISEVVEACEDHRDHLKRVRTAHPAGKRPYAADLERPEGDLANLFLPENHPRYAFFVEWGKDHDRKWWKFGVSSDGRKGIWIPHRAWEGLDVNNLEAPRR